MRTVNSNAIAKSLHHISRPAQVGTQRLRILINPSHATGFFLYLLKTSENLWFSDVFRGHRKTLVA